LLTEVDYFHNNLWDQITTSFVPRDWQWLYIHSYMIICIISESN